jgi:serine/threonine protein kinase
VGRTYRALHNVNGEVAIKKISLNIDNCGPLATEISIMKSCTHPNIVTYYDSFLLETENELWVVMEYMEFTSLTKIIHLFDELRMDEPHMAYCIREVIASLYL